MKKMIVMTLLTLSTTMTFANKNKDNYVGVAMSKVLSSEKAPNEAKQLVSSILLGQDYNERVSIIESEVSYSLGKAYVTLQIGVDDMNDDDYGWGAVYQIDIELTRNAAGDDYTVSSVNVEIIAG